MNKPLLVSACLLGMRCRYDGGSRPCAKLIAMHEQGLVTAICPESLGPLPRPRPPAEQRGGRVFSKDGRDVTAAFELGAQRALAIARRSGARCAVLKARSPSCGLGQIYDGSFTGTLTSGNGIFTQKLLQEGWEVFTEETYGDERPTHSGHLACGPMRAPLDCPEHFFALKL